MKSLQECNCILLENSLSGKIYIDMYDKMSIKKLGNYHLYITNPNDEIKQGDWCIYTDILGRRSVTMQMFKGCTNQLKNWEKIIATTDVSLKVYDNSMMEFGQFGYKLLPKPSNEFLKKYCKLGGIDKVLVEYEELPNWGKEEIFSIKIAPDNTITIKEIKAIKDSYSREEVIKLIKEAWNQANNNTIPRMGYISRTDWIEKNL